MIDQFARVHIVRQADGVRVKALYKEVIVWCPGCKARHSFNVKAYNNYRTSPDRELPIWGWDRNLTKPTFTPSLLCYSSVHLCEHTYEVCEDHENCEEKSHKILNYYDELDEEKWVYAHERGEHLEKRWGRCHSFLREGIWQFLNDSQHSLAGKDVPMVPLPPRLLVHPF